MPNLYGASSTRSTPSAWTSKIRSIVFCDSSRRPPASPPSGITRSTSSTPRAFEWPFSAPRSAARHSGVVVALVDMTGPVHVRIATEVMSTSGFASGRGGGTTGAIRSQSACRAPTWKSAPSGPAISSATNCLKVRPVIRRISSPTR